MKRFPYGSIHMKYTYFNQSIINIIPSMYKSSIKPTPMVQLLLAKNDGDQARKMTVITDQ